MRRGVLPARVDERLASPPSFSCLHSQLLASTHMRHTPCQPLELCATRARARAHTHTHIHVGAPGTRADAQEWMWGEGAEASTACLKIKLEEEELGMRAKYESFFGLPAPIVLRVAL